MNTPIPIPILASMCHAFVDLQTIYQVVASLRRSPFDRLVLIKVFWEAPMKTLEHQPNIFTKENDCVGKWYFLQQILWIDV